MLIKKSYTSYFLLVGFLLFPAVVGAQFTATPIIIDHTTEARDIIDREITLTNQSDLPVVLYASVHEIAVDAGGEIREFVTPAMTDRATTITSWIEITRARLELPPQSERKVPLTVRIHPHAPPGTYHALIGFAAGDNRDQIEQKVMRGEGAQVILKIVIADTAREQLRVVNFTTERINFKDPDATLSVLLENTGDTPLTPVGEVIIYDTAGNELAAVSVNTNQKTIVPGERMLLSEPLPVLTGMGRHKAALILAYGKDQSNVYDTAFYYNLPWYYLLLVLLVLVFMLSVVVWLFSRLYGRGDSYSDLQDLPVYVSKRSDHNAFDHDINLKHDKNQNN